MARTYMEAMLAAAVARSLSQALDLLDDEHDERHRTLALELSGQLLERLADAGLVDLNLRDGRTWAAAVVDSTPEADAPPVRMKPCLRLV